MDGAVREGGVQLQRINPGLEHGVDALQGDHPAIAHWKKVERIVTEHASERDPVDRRYEDLGRRALLEGQGRNLG